VRKRAFSHFGYGTRTLVEKCKKMPFAVLHKFRNCEGLVPKEMTFEEMQGEVLGLDGGDEGVVQSPLAACLEELEVPCDTNELVHATSDSVDSTR
jgi:hypothetical protein